MISYPSKGIVLLLAFFSITGIFGIDKFYTGNYILGIIQSILSVSYIGFTISMLINYITLIALFIVIFTNINLLFYINWTQPTTLFDYSIAIIILLYIIIKQNILYNQDLNNIFS